MANNEFNNTVSTLFKGMDSFISSKTVVGDPVKVNDTVIIPLMDVSFGVGAGAFSKEKSNNAAGAMTGKMSPSAVLVIHNGVTKLVNIKNQDTMTKIMDMVPDFIDKFTSKNDSDLVVDEDVDSAINDISNNEWWKKKIKKSLKKDWFLFLVLV